jgi:hypothetical protein
MAPVTAVATVAVGAAAGPRRAHRRSVLTRRPELVPLGVAGPAWLVVAVAGGTGGHPGQAGGPVGAAAMTAVMVIAMTAPFAVPGVRTAVFTSLWRLARRVAACYTGAFLVAWSAIAAGLALAGAALTWAIPAGSAGCLLLVAAALAQADPERRRLLAGCARPARIRPRTALPDAIRSGALDAARCARLCALPMLAMLVLPAGIALMVALTGLALAERIFEGRRWGAVAAGYLSLPLALDLTPAAGH